MVASLGEKEDGEAGFLQFPSDRILATELKTVVVEAQRWCQNDGFSASVGVYRESVDWKLPPVICLDVEAFEPGKVRRLCKGGVFGGLEPAVGSLQGQFGCGSSKPLGLGEGGVLKDLRKLWTVFFHSVSGRKERRPSEPSGVFGYSLSEKEAHPGPQTLFLLSPGRGATSGLSSICFRNQRDLRNSLGLH